MIGGKWQRTAASRLLFLLACLAVQQLFGANSAAELHESPEGTYEGHGFSLDDDDYEDILTRIKFERWTIKHKRTYEGREEKEAMLRMFKSNLESIESDSANILDSDLLDSMESENTKHDEL